MLSTAITYTVGAAERAFAQAPACVLLDTLAELVDAQAWARDAGLDAELARATHLHRMATLELRARN